MQLISNPYRPSDQRRAGNCFPKRRRQIRQAIVMLYEKRMETVPRELKALNAVYEPWLFVSVCQMGCATWYDLPRLMRESKLVMTAESMIALTGMFHLAGT